MLTVGSETTIAKNIEDSGGNRVANKGDVVVVVQVIRDKPDGEITGYYVNHKGIGWIFAVTKTEVNNG